MRTRKPWVRFRFRLLGWNVLFMVFPFCPRILGAETASGQTLERTGNPRFLSKETDPVFLKPDGLYASVTGLRTANTSTPFP
jgi:hypothetical protein